MTDTCTLPAGHLSKEPCNAPIPNPGCLDHGLVLERGHEVDCAFHYGKSCDCSQHPKASIPSRQRARVRNRDGSVGEYACGERTPVNTISDSRLSEIQSYSDPEYRRDHGTDPNATESDLCMDTRSALLELRRRRARERDAGKVI